MEVESTSKNWILLFALWNCPLPRLSFSLFSRLLQGIVEAVENGDVEAFTNTVYEFDSIATLDPWKTKILLRIKNGLKSNEEDLT